MAWVDGTPDPPPSGPKTGGGCGRCTARLWLVVFNVIFALLGCGLIALGYMLRFESALFETYILDIMTSAQVDGVDLKSVFQSVSIVVMLLGFVVLVFAGMGILGGCCQVKMLLTVYALVMLKIIILEIVAVVLLLVFRDEIDSKIKGALQTTLDTYEGWNSTQPVSIGWNYVFSKLDCCGIDDYKDIANNDTDWNDVTSFGGVVFNLTTPIFCCDLEGTYPYADLPTDLDCAVSPNATTSNYMKGCYDAFEDYLLGYRMTLYVVGGLILLCEVMNIVTAVIVRQGLVSDEGKKRKHKRKMRAFQRRGNKIGY